MNRYTYEFKCKCPNNQKMIDYKLVIETNEVIMVENLKEILSVESAYHEDLAEKIQFKFPGNQYLVAFHDDVLIETWRK